MPPVIDDTMMVRGWHLIAEANYFDNVNFMSSHSIKNLITTRMNTLKYRFSLFTNLYNNNINTLTYVDYSLTSP